MKKLTLRHTVFSVACAAGVTFGLAAVTGLQEWGSRFVEIRTLADENRDGYTSHLEWDPIYQRLGRTYQPEENKFIPEIPLFGPNSLSQEELDTISSYYHGGEFSRD